MDNICNNKLSITAEPYIMRRFLFMRKKRFSAFGKRTLAIGLNDDNTVSNPLCLFTSEREDGLFKGVDSTIVKHDIRFKEDSERIASGRVCEEGQTNGNYTVEFDSPWSPLEDFTRKISEEFPEAEVRLAYSESESKQAGMIKFYNGEIDSECFGELFEVKADALIQEIIDDGIDYYGDEDDKDGHIDYFVRNYNQGKVDDKMNASLVHEHIKSFSNEDRNDWCLDDYILFGDVILLNEYLEREDTDLSQTGITGYPYIMTAILNDGINDEVKINSISLLLGKMSNDEIINVRDMYGNNLLHYVVGKVSYFDKGFAEHLVDELKERGLYEPLLMEPSEEGVYPALYDSSFVPEDCCFGGEVFNDFVSAANGRQDLFDPNILLRMMLKSSNEDIVSLKIDLNDFGTALRSKRDLDISKDGFFNFESLYSMCMNLFMEKNIGAQRDNLPIDNTAERLRKALLSIAVDEDPEKLVNISSRKPNNVTLRSDESGLATILSYATDIDSLVMEKSELCGIVCDILKLRDIDLKLEADGRVTYATVTGEEKNRVSLEDVYQTYNDADFITDYLVGHKVMMNNTESKLARPSSTRF